MMNLDNKKKVPKICTNCNKKGHDMRDCRDPVSSWGIILIKINNYCHVNDMIKLMGSKNTNDVTDKIIDINMNGIRGENIKDLQLFSALQNCIEFLIIRRKHTLGYIEFVRGRYKIDNIDGIIFLFQQMTKEEIKKIETMSYDELWENLWGNSIDNDKKKTYHQEYVKAKTKFEELKNNNTELGLNFYVKNVDPAWDQAEWGFPKGRRNKNETIIECAKREFREESGYSDNDYEILTNIEPLVEEFIGTNGVRYKHVYYIAVDKNTSQPKIKPDNGEVGAIGFYNYNEIIQLIRPYHIERKKLIVKLYMYVINKLIAGSESTNTITL